MSYILAALFALAPIYRIRLSLAGIPLNALEIAVFVFWIIFAVWLIKKKQVTAFRDFLVTQPRFFLIATSVFFISGLLAFYISSAGVLKAGGMFLVLFFQPILSYFPAAYLLQKEANKALLLKVFFWLIIVLSVYGIFQYYTKIGLPVAWWGNPVEPKRALSVFNHPNAFAMFIGPLLAFCLPFLFSTKLYSDYLKSNWQRYIPAAAFLTGLFAFVLTLSRSGWLAMICVIIIFALLAKDKRVRLFMLVLLLAASLTVAITPKLRERVTIVFQGEKATLSRFSLWNTAWRMIDNSPVTGHGLYGFQNQYDNYNLDSLTQAYPYPHNIFLNFWVDTGLYGMLSFLAIAGYSAYRALRKQTLFNVGLLLFLVYIFAHGMFDHPYFKNDLALTFWLIMAMRE
jgi:putative inorganic carbon (hco3(-)) transporter